MEKEEFGIFERLKKTDVLAEAIIKGFDLLGVGMSYFQMDQENIVS